MFLLNYFTDSSYSTSGGFFKDILDLWVILQIVLPFIVLLIFFTLLSISSNTKKTYAEIKKLNENIYNVFVKKNQNNSNDNIQK